MKPLRKAVSFLPPSLSLCGLIIASLWLLAAFHPRHYLSMQITSNTDFTLGKMSFGIQYETKEDRMLPPGLPPPPATVPYDEWMAIDYAGPPLGHLGFAFDSRIDSYKKRWEATYTRLQANYTHYILLPHWMSIPLILASPARRLHFRHRAPRQGLCPNCSYDLRAHLAGRAGKNCPECGTPVVLESTGRKPQT